ncbi:MAG: efflux RND transporter permease subunit, partial [Candidatus Deferrimicrobiaceae bacterium]
TTMSALMATLPIAIGFGAGAEARRPMGIAVVGGLLFSQIITLYITPVIYTFLDGFQAAFRGWMQRIRETLGSRQAKPALPFDPSAGG